MTPEEERKERRREQMREYSRRRYVANREAIKEQSRAYYEANRESIRTKKVEYTAKNRDRVKSAREARKLAAIEKMGGCCADCKQTYPPAVYDFHHLEPTAKEHEPKRLFGQKDQDRIDAELAKCVLLCSNCHRLRHYYTD